MRKKLTTDRQTSHMNLIGKWFDMTYSGFKTVDYRDMTPYWDRRIDKTLKNVDTIIFSNGYAKDRRQFEVISTAITIGYGRPEWGAKHGVQYFVFHHGEILQSNF